MAYVPGWLMDEAGQSSGKRVALATCCGAIAYTAIRCLHPDAVVVEALAAIAIAALAGTSADKYTKRNAPDSAPASDPPVQP